MHYKNGRKAEVGDAVIGLTYNRPGVQVGIVKHISQDQETCNVTLDLATKTFGRIQDVEYSQCDWLLRADDCYHFVIGLAFSPHDQDYIAKIINFKKGNAPMQELPPHERPNISK